MRAPDFWNEDSPTLAARLLSPFGHIYGTATLRRMNRKGFHAPVPVLCVGNFTVGGTGKTPTCLKLAQMLYDLGEKPAFLSRGHGGSEKGPIRVEPTRHDASQVGDEPLLLANIAPTYIARNREQAARLALESNASCLILDDGLQNPSLAKDWSVAVVDAFTGFGNGLCLPAGPLRAPLRQQWNKVQSLLVIGQSERGQAIAEEARALGKTIYRATLEPDPTVAASLKGRRIAAFAGIGNPEKFRRTLEHCGAELALFQGFPDHHFYSVQELLNLKTRAQDLPLVTTQKDIVKLEKLKLPASIREAIIVLPVSLHLEEEKAMQDALKAVLDTFRKR